LAAGLRFPVLSAVVAKAGFWPIGGYVISFRRDGNWYADDERIENKRIATLFSRNLRLDPDRGWVVDLGVDCQSVTVEDTPLVVVAVQSEESNECLRVRTNDGVTRRLDPGTLSVAADNVIYGKVNCQRRGWLRARFLRPAYYALAEHINYEDGRSVLRWGGNSYQLVHEVSPARQRSEAS